MNSRRWTGKAGFTAVEILIGAAILGILAALSARPIKGLIQRIRLTSAADGLKHYIQTVKIRATANTLVHCGVVFVDNPSATDSDSVFAFLDKSIPPNNVYDPGTDQRYLGKLVFQKSENLELNIPGGLGSTTIVFRGDGSANTSVNVSLVLGNFQNTIDVLASTGRVKVTNP